VPATSTTSTTARPADVTLRIDNGYPATVVVNVDGHRYTLAPGEKVAPFPVVRAADGHNVIEVGLPTDPTCGFDGGSTFPAAGRYVLEIGQPLGAPGGCGVAFMVLQDWIAP